MTVQNREPQNCYQQKLLTDTKRFVLSATALGCRRGAKTKDCRWVKDTIISRRTACTASCFRPASFMEAGMLRTASRVADTAKLGLRSLSALSAAARCNDVLAQI